MDIVTEYDIAAEASIIDLIRGHFPHHSIWAEESGNIPSYEKDNEICWIIDPLDGTMNFSRHLPFFAVSIAACRGNSTEVGVIYLPMTDELFIAQKGFGAYLNGYKINVSTVSEMPQAIAATGFPYGPCNTRQRSTEQFLKSLDVGNPIRIVGSAALNLAYVAAGRFDVYWGTNLKPWDIAAGKLLIEEAGGKVSRYNGHVHDTWEFPDILATNHLLHPHMLACLNVP